MAPIKAPKKGLKFTEKPIEKPITKSKKNKKKNYHNFSIYLYKLLKSVSQNKMGITQKSMLIMNNFVYDIMEKLATEAGRLVAQTKRTTVSSREIHTAVKLLVPGELAKHAHIDAMKALTMYHNSIDKDN